MPIIQAGKIKLYYEESGGGEAGAVVLIRGQGTQMVHWPATFYDAFAACGYRTVRFDNRDTGLSQKFDHIGDAELAAIRRKIAAGEAFDPPYTLDDMALDVIHLMDALDIAKAHIAGISMGGFISQVLAAKYPSRVASMTSIMSSSGGNLDPQLIDRLWSQRVSRETYIQEWVEYIRTFGSPKYAAGDAHSREAAAAAYDRCYSPDGANRQLLAIFSAGGMGLPSLVRTIAVPALVVHGSDDGLIPPEKGRETAELIPNATFRLVEGMGHDTPPDLGPPLADIVLAHMHAVESS
ncbi:MAG: alpha/beta fold hydrolase [Deltaproteobacteria bacterium]|nr:alpha/beta fold hydrolase [Deltaproteobacteria bacterium]